jgi:hypothetical protein
MLKIVVILIILLIISNNICEYPRSLLLLDSLCAFFAHFLLQISQFDCWRGFTTFVVWSLTWYWLGAISPRMSAGFPFVGYKSMDGFLYWRDHLHSRFCRRLIILCYFFEDTTPVQIDAPNINFIFSELVYVRFTVVEWSFRFGSISPSLNILARKFNFSTSVSLVVFSSFPM